MTKVIREKRDEIIVDLINKFGDFAKLFHDGKNIEAEDLNYINSMKALLGLIDDPASTLVTKEAVIVAISEFKARFQGSIGNKEESSLMLIEEAICKTIK